MRRKEAIRVKRGMTGHENWIIEMGDSVEIIITMAIDGERTEIKRMVGGTREMTNTTEVPKEEEPIIIPRNSSHSKTQ